MNNKKFLGLTLTKQVKGLYNKKFKILKRQIGEDIVRWKKILPCLWISGINTVKNYLTKINLEIWRNLHQNYNTIFFRPLKTNSQYHVEKKNRRGINNPVK